MNATPNRNAFLCAGNIAANRPLFGGTFVPGVTANGTTVLPKPLFAAVFVIPVDATGYGTLTTSAWEGAPPGTQTYWPVAFKDGPWAYSNAVLFTRP